MKSWTDRVVEAHFSDALLYGSGETEADALDELRTEMMAVYARLRNTDEAAMARPALRMWRALRAVCIYAENET